MNLRNIDRLLQFKLPSFIKSVIHGAFVHDYSYQRSQIINGKAIARKILSVLKSEIDEWIQLGNKRPHLTAVAIGSDPASDLYLRNKAKAAAKCGVTTNVISCPSDINEHEIIRIIQNLNCNDAVDAILIQLPLPEHLNEKTLLDCISLKKDVDGFKPMNLAFMLCNDVGIVPCAVLAVNTMVQQIGIPTKGLNATVVGTSQYIGLPIAISLHSQYNPATRVGLEMTTTLCNINTQKEFLHDLLKKSDLIVSATGVPGLIKGDMIKEGSIVIDVGTSFLKSKSGKERVKGDVEFEDALARASYVSPVPGGVGPVTVAMLMRNTLHCARLQRTRELTTSS